MESQEIDVRKQKGQQIASGKQIRKMQGSWVVPSQTGNGVYVVSKSGCTCPDWETHRDRCKHMFAVEFHVERRQNKDGSVTVTREMVVTERKTYPQDWANYNAAQMQEKDYFGTILKGLCANLKEEEGPRGRGRPRASLSDAVFGSVWKVYSSVSGRRATCDIRACKEKGLMDKQPHFNSIFRYLRNEELTPILEEMLLQTALPLKAFETTFSIDSSGFGTNVYGNWADEKYGDKTPVEERHETGKRNKWFKAHIAIGNKTNVITKVIITESNSHDNNHFIPLLKGTAENFDVSEIMADKGYQDKKNFVAAEEMGIEPYIMFKKGMQGNGPEIVKKLFFMYLEKNDEFRAHYHQRSNVETAFSMIKKKFGHSLKSKTRTALKNEILCKLLAHNICCLISAIFELGVDTEFLTRRQAA